MANIANHPELAAIFSELTAAEIDTSLAYEIVQRNAMAAWDREVPLRGLLEADPEVAGVLDASELDAIFDLDALLVHVDEIFDRTLRRPEVAHA